MKLFNFIMRPIVVGIIGFLLYMTYSHLTHATEVGVLFGGVTAHHSVKFAPSDGYNWNNQTLGIEILQDNEGLNFGVSGARFKDSYFQRSTWLMGTVEYRTTYEYVSLSTGIGLGHLKTSYYDGVIAAPYLKARHNNTGLYGKILVQPISNSKADGFTTVLVGLSKKF